MNTQAQDFNWNFGGDRPAISEPIPDGTILYLSYLFTPGGYNPPGMNVDGALTKSKPSADKPNNDTAYLKSEFTVLRGPYAGRKFWGNLTCVGGEVDERGQSKAGAISRSTIRSMLDSAQGLSSKDESPEAAGKRVLPKRFMSLQGIKFFAKVKLKPASGGYPAKNELGQVMTIDMTAFPGRNEDGTIDMTRLWQEIDHPKIIVAAPSRATMAAAPSWATPGAGAAPFGGATAALTATAGVLGAATALVAVSNPPPPAVPQPFVTQACEVPAATHAANSIPQWMQ